MNKGLTLRMGQCNTRRHMPHLLERIRKGDIDVRLEGAEGPARRPIGPGRGPTS